MRILTAIRGNKRKKGRKLANNKHCMKSVELWTGQKKKEISPSFVKKKKKKNKNANFKVTNCETRFCFTLSS